MKISGKLVFIALACIAPAHAGTHGSVTASAVAACQHSVIAPGPSAPSLLLRHTAFHGDRVVNANPTSCCGVLCTQMLSTTRLEPAHEPGRT